MGAELLDRNIVEDLYRLDERKIIHVDVTLRKSLLFISCNYQENISTRDVARHCGVSADYISYLIRVNTGFKCCGLIRELKLMHASELVVSNRSLTEIAHSIGFCDLAHFSRAYKKRFGMSPSTQRKKIGNAGSEMYKAKE